MQWGKRMKHANLPARAATAMLCSCCSIVAAAHDGGGLSGQTATAPEPIDQALGETRQGHGSISIAYINTLVNGFKAGGMKIPIGAVRSHTLSFGVDYFLTDNWSVSADIPYIINRYRGPDPHCPTSAPPPCAHFQVLQHPHPESKFLDDGKFHGDWQDWGFGGAYHANFHDYLLTPFANLYIPSHAYTFYSQAAVGTRLRRLEVGATLAHQFAFSNLYYRLGYARVFQQRTTDQNVDYNKVDLEAGYFLNPAWSVKLFANGKKGGGYTGEYDFTSDIWYRHDQRAPHAYASAGFGTDWRFNDRYTLTGSLQREIWGLAIFDFKYALELRLTREF